MSHILSAIPGGLGREEWLHALPRALVAGFVKTDKEFQSRGMNFVLTCLNFFYMPYLNMISGLHAFPQQDKLPEQQQHL